LQLNIRVNITLENAKSWVSMAFSVSERPSSRFIRDPKQDWKC
jgi:hypothetical protein